MVKIKCRHGMQNIPFRVLKHSVDLLETVRELEDNGMFGRITSKILLEAKVEKKRKFSLKTAFMLAYAGFLRYSCIGFYSNKSQSYRYQNSWKLNKTGKYTINYLKQKQFEYEEKLKNKEIEQKEEEDDVFT